MKYFLATLALFLPGICGAQQQQCVGYGCPPTQASVSDLLEASRANKSPGISFAEGAARGFAQGMELRRQQEELKQLQEQREQLQRDREQREQESKARPQEAPAPAPAATYWDPTTVQGLMERCRNGNDYDEGLCDGYFSAWMESFIITGKKSSFCFPVGTSVTMAQMKAVYIQWADRNPGKWHLGSLVNLNESMKEAFPCPKAKTASSNWKDRAEKVAK